MDADGAWTKSNICSRIPGVGSLLRAARLLYGDDMVSNETSLSMPGVKCGTSIQLVLDRRGGDLFRFLHSQKRRAHLPIRLEKWTLSRLFHGFRFST